MAVLQQHDGKKDNFPSSSVTVLDNLDRRLSLLSHRLRDPATEYKARKKKQLQGTRNRTQQQVFVAGLITFIAMQKR